MKTWSSPVVIDESGVEGIGNDTKGSLRWDEINGLDYDRNARHLIIGLLDNAGQFRPLPFVTKELYEALRERVGPIKDVEGECLLK